jgi:hypothetical protein
MSGVASIPPASSAPSAARADDLFALVKFVHSDDAQARLKELQEAEQRATEQRASADAVIEAARVSLAEVNTQRDQHKAEVASFKTEQADHIERHARREAALSAREASVLSREDRLTQREREHATVLAATEAEFNQRDARFTQRERELDRSIQVHEAQRAAFERRQTAIDQAMRS